MRTIISYNSMILRCSGKTDGVGRVRSVSKMYARCSDVPPPFHSSVCSHSSPSLKEVIQLSMKSRVKRSKSGSVLLSYSHSHYYGSIFPTCNLLQAHHLEQWPCLGFSRTAWKSGKVLLLTIVTKGIKDRSSQIQDC